MARIAEDFPLACPACGGNIRLIASISDPAPIRKFLTYLGEHWVQALLGHNDVKTTMIYTHVLNQGGVSVRSPADRLGLGR